MGIKKQTSSFLMLGIMLLVGIFLLARPGASLVTAAKIIGGALVVIGAIGLINQLLHPEDRALPRVLVYAVEVVAGLVIFSAPGFVISLFPILVGIVVMVYGLSDVQTALRLKKEGHPTWARGMVLAVISVVLGLILLMNPFGTVSTLVRIIGIVLIYKAVTGFLLQL